MEIHIYNATRPNPVGKICLGRISPRRYSPIKLSAFWPNPITSRNKWIQQFPSVLPLTFSWHPPAKSLSVIYNRKRYNLLLLIEGKEEGWYREIGGGGGFFLFFLALVRCQFRLNTSNANATFVQSTLMQRLLKAILTLACWYCLDSSRRVLSNKYPCALVSVVLVFFASFCHWPN